MGNLIDNILNKTTELFGKSSNPSVLGIDIGSSSIKVVQIQKKNNRAVLQTYGEIALGPYAGVEVGRSTKLDSKKLSEALSDLLKESNTSTTQSALSIPMNMSMVSVISLPEADKKKLGQMVQMEARKYIPVPITEVAMDWFVIPRPEIEQEDSKFSVKPGTFESGPSSINRDPAVSSGDFKKVETMIVAIHNDTLNDFSAVVQNTSLNSSFFEIEMFSTARSVLDFNYTNPVMIIDIGASATKVYITERGVVRASHNAGRGSQDLTLNISRSMNLDIAFAEKIKRNYGLNDPDKDKKISELIDNIFNPIFSSANDIMVDYQRKNHKIISKIIMVGGGSLLTGIKEKAQRYFSVETELGLPFEKLQTPAFLDPVLKKNGVIFAGAIGLAVRLLQESS